MVLPPYAAYKDYKFMKTAASLVYFNGEIFAMRLLTLRFWALFRYGAHACRSKIAKSTNLIKFANSPRTPCIGELRGASNLASNLTRKLAVQTLALVKITQISKTALRVRF